MNLVSFSVYGNSPKYLLGAIRNAQFINKVMTDWTPIFFLDDNVSESFTKKLRAEGAIIRTRNSDWHTNGMFWRFRAFFEENANLVLIRDCDSRISHRELLAIDLWLQSGKSAHIIRDHPLHQSLIMGGMWGAKAAFLKNLNIWDRMRQFGVERGEDQNFLNANIYPILVTDALIHDSFFRFETGSSKIPLVRKNGEFIGEVIDENEDFDVNSRAYLTKIENSRVRRTLLRIEVFVRFRFAKFKTSRRECENR
jgi:hypothetical protein